MDDRGIKSGNPIGDADIALASILCGGLHMNHLRQKGFIGTAEHPHLDPAGQIECSCLECIAGFGGNRHCFTGYKRAVKICGTCDNNGISR